jgi:hypothetical protein
MTEVALMGTINSYCAVAPISTSVPFLALISPFILHHGMKIKSIVKLITVVRYIRRLLNRLTMLTICLIYDLNIKINGDTTDNIIL